MLITLNQKDICKIIAQAMTGNPSITESSFTVEVGVQDNSIVAVVAAGEPLPRNLVQLSALAEPKTSGVAIAPPADSAPVADSDDDLEDDPDSPPQENGQPKKRKRRTKAQIEEDRLKEEAQAQAELETARLKEAQAQAETPVEATEAVATEQAADTPEPAKDDPFAAMAEPATDHAAAHQETAAEVALDEATPPFDIEEGAVVRAQKDDAPLADPNDPFAGMSEVSSNADELFAQPADAKVTSVTKEEDGFVKPVEEETDDPFASFN